MVPEEWKDTKMGAVFSSRREKGRKGLPTLSVTLNDGLVPRDDLERKMETNLSAEEHLLVRPGDIAYNMMRMWQGASGLCSEEAIVSPAYIVLEPNNQIDPIFASYLFKLSRTVHNFWAYSYGLTNDRLRLYFRDFSMVPLGLPPMSEQKRIAEILETWDRAIETIEKLIANSQTQKKALMQQLLTGKKRLPGFDGEWKAEKLSNLCTVRRGASPRPISSPKWFAEHGRGWIRISDVTGSATERLEKTDQYLSQEGEDKSVKVDPGDLVMSICATIGVPKFIGIPACIHDGFVVFREVSPNLDLGFLYYILEEATERLANSGQPGTQKNLNTTIVGNISVPIISCDEQEKIVQILRAADQIVRDLASKRQALEAEKAALMQQLLTGKRRVKIEESAA
ncbi:MAG: restriction endonuclease subunit S [Gammaproteobacteria bacterium]|nr:restriction endonuclease subunit S [Gammaproteobacteria bacterium]